MMDMARLWETSLRGGALILLALLARSWKGRAPKWAAAWLWTAAAVRLLLPGNLVVPIQSRCAPEELVSASASAASPGLTWFFQTVWAAGAGLALTCLLLRAWLAHRQIRRAVPLQDSFCQQLIDRQRLRRPVRLLICDSIGTPLTCGLLRPRILLPRRMDLTDREGLTCALTHELVHIRRLDALRKGLTRAALCLHWFNPLAWTLVCLADQDFEQACDEKALSLLGAEQKRRYALSLLRLAEQSCRPAPLHSGFGLIGQNGLEERIGSIMKYQKLSRRTALAAALAVAAAATVSAAELKPTEPDAAAALPMAAQLETEVPNSKEIGAADATLKLAKEDGRTEVWNVTLKNGQPITYTLNPDHCQDIEGNIVYSVNQR
jgi:beta-lactamase regulating signal transducer with metallopeptidase domain